MVGAIVLPLSGYMKIGQEREQDFFDKIKYADNCTENRKYDKAEEYYNEAIKIKIITG